MAMLEQRYIHICEVCGKREILTADEAFDRGWDYPPRMGWFGVVSPRKCSDCPITETLYWAITMQKKDISALSAKQRETFERILREPDSIMVGTN